MRRTNTFEIVPRSTEEDEILQRLLDASASLWNEVTYERRQRWFNGNDVWDCAEYREQYSPILGAATVQTIRRQNDATWRAFFAKLRNGHKSNPPGYWGNEEEGRDLRTYLRNDSYTIQWGHRSRIELVVGQELKSDYEIPLRSRPRFVVRGCPRWRGKQGRMVIAYDEIGDSYRVFQSVTVPERTKERPSGDEVAALDIGANNLVACSTTIGTRLLYEGRELFEQFRETTHEIARLRSKLPQGRYSSNRIRRLYRKQTRRRNHAQDALIRDLVDRLHEEGVATVFIGDLTGVRRPRWQVEVNAKIHDFWAFRRFTDRLSEVCAEKKIVVEVEDEAWTSRECPDCGEREETIRHDDSLWCPCGFEGHADLTASETFLRRNVETSVRPMARPVRFKWDNHQWRSTRDAPIGNPNEQRTNP